MPKESRFQFIKEVFIDKIYKDESIKPMSHVSDSDVRGMRMLCCAIHDCTPASANVYRWYRFAPFDVAFFDLKKLIRTETSPDERNAIFFVLVTCARHNMHHIQAIIQYYHEKHINEPFKFKVQFVNTIVTQTCTHKFDEKTWTILNELYHSLEVFIESNNDVQTCVESIIVYKTLHSEAVPEIIEKKFAFVTLKEYRKKLNEEEKEKLFQYLHNYLKKKIENVPMADNTEYLQLLQNAFHLLIDWEKELLDYSWILNKVKECVQVKRDKSWEINLSFLYNIKKSWRKHMFEESLVLHPSEETCLNVLKHNPEILKRYKMEVDIMCFNDSMSLKILLNKLRTYWAQTLAKEWAASYRARLQQSNGHRALIRGLGSLLMQHQMLEIIMMYEPKDSKINWSEADELKLSLQRHIAKNMHCARPQPPPTAVICYAKGDYLQYALPSLCAIFYNLSAYRSREHILKLLDAPISVQKHGLRLAFFKLKTNDVKQIFSDIWRSNKNASIRAVLFKHTYGLLCREKNPKLIEEIWELLETFIDNLSPDENKGIYELLGKLDKVPYNVKGKYCMKSYKYLKSLPPKANCENILDNVKNHIKNIMELLDSDFVSDILSEFIDNKFLKIRNDYHDSYYVIPILTSYVLYATDEISQEQKFEKILVPLMERCFSMWGAMNEEKYYIRQNFYDLLNNFRSDFQKYVLERNVILPIAIFTKILNSLESELSVQENYSILRSWKLTVAFVKQLDKFKSMVPKVTENTENWEMTGNKWNEIYLKVAPEFGKICAQYVKEDVKQYFPSIYLLFAYALELFFDKFGIETTVQLTVFRSIIDDTEIIQPCLLVLNMLPQYIDKQDKPKMRDIRDNILLRSSVELTMHYYHKFRRDELID